MKPIRAWAEPAELSCEVNQEKSIEQINSAYATCTEEIPQFLARVANFGIATTAIGVVVIIAAYYGGARADIVEAVYAAYLFIFLFFIGCLPLSSLLASDKHLSFLFFKIGMRMGAILAREERKRERIVERSANFAHLMAKMACGWQLSIWGIFSSTISKLMVDYFEARDGYQSNNKGSPYFIHFLAIFIASCLLAVFLFASDQKTRRISGRNQFGEVERAISGDDVDKQKAGILSTIDIHIGLIWGINDNWLCILQHWQMFFYLVQYCLVIAMIIADRLGEAMNDSKVKQSLISAISTTIFLTGYYFAVIILPSYVIYLSILVAFSVLNEKWKNRESQVDLESNVPFESNTAYEI